MLQRTTRKPFQIACLALLLTFACVPALAQAVRPLANDYVVVYESPDADSVYVYSPGITVCPNGRLIATCDLGGRGAGERRKADPTFTRGRAFISDDHGKTWRPSVGFSMWAARPFVVNDSLYILGADGDLKILRSDDWGDTWTGESKLTDGDVWHQAPCNVWYANGNVYLVMERNVYDDVKTWSVSVLAPVLMRGKVGDDLLKRESWTFASEMAFRDAVPARNLDYFGVPFFDFYPHESFWTAPRRNMAPPGWLETNVVQITDPNHYWFDPTGHTFHLFMRAHTGGTGYAAMVKVVEQPDGSMKTVLETNPSGKKVVFLPLPGGQMKFHILYDEQTKLYWLLSSQATDSMTRSEALPPERFNLPNNERHRLQLHFSKNMVDWCFAGIVAIGDSPKQSRHYASMVIDGDDLHILSRSGDARSHDAHNGNILTFHTVKNFRDLVY